LVVVQKVGIVDRWMVVVLGVFVNAGLSVVQNTGYFSVKIILMNIKLIVFLSNFSIFLQMKTEIGTAVS
jgi:hypothetical protein